MKDLILTVQPSSNNSYRLGISVKDSKNVFKCRKVKVWLILNSREICCKTSCGNPCDSNGNWVLDKKIRKKGYDLNSTELSEWIKENKFHLYERGDPTKLLFNLIEIGSSSEKGFRLKFISAIII